ncbi:hypothetical protein ACFE04_025228 [Oxalis oulophora]
MEARVETLEKMVASLQTKIDTQYAALRVDNADLRAGLDEIKKLILKNTPETDKVIPNTSSSYTTEESNNYVVPRLQYNKHTIFTKYEIHPIVMQYVTPPLLANCLNVVITADVPIMVGLKIFKALGSTNELSFDFEEELTYHNPVLQVTSAFSQQLKKLTDVDTSVYGDCLPIKFNEFHLGDKVFLLVVGIVRKIIIKEFRIPPDPPDPPDMIHDSR